MAAYLWESQIWLLLFSAVQIRVYVRLLSNESFRYEHSGVGGLTGRVLLTSRPCLNVLVAVYSFQHVLHKPKAFSTAPLSFAYGPNRMIIGNESQARSSIF